MKNPTIATINIEGINTTTVVTPELRCLHPKEITDAYSEMIDALIVAHNQVLGVCEHNERLNNGLPSELDRADLKQIEQALKKAGCYE